MDFELDDEQRMLREVSRDILAAHSTPEQVRVRADSKAEMDDKLWSCGVDIGWTGLAAPERCGGAGMGLVEVTLVAEEVGRALAPGAWCDTAVAALMAAEGGAPDDVVTALSTGEHRAAVLLDPNLVESAASADWLLLVEPGSGKVGLADPGTAHLRRRCTIDQTRSFFAVSPVPQPVHILAVNAQRVRDAVSILIAADALGVGERLLEMTVDYAKVRHQFGRPIGSFQAIKHKVADMLVALKGLRAATYYAALAFDAAALDASTAASVAKAFAAEQVPAIAAEALQIHGGIGFTWEHDLHLYLRRAKTDEVLGGTADFHHQRIALSPSAF